MAWRKRANEGDFNIFRFYSTSSWEVMNVFNSYMDNSFMRPVLDLVESKTHVERSIIVSGLVCILAIYLTIGWHNQFLCNLIGVAYPMYATIKAVQSPKISDYRQLLIYWVVYLSLICVEYFGYGLFDLLGFSFACLEHCLSYLVNFYWSAKYIFACLGYWLSSSGSLYWLAKCIFLLWFMDSGLRIITRRFA